MATRILTAIAAALLVIILLSRAGRDREPLSTAEGVADPQSEEPAPPPPRSVARVTPHPDALTAEPVGTPTLDLLGILAVRRRIDREGNAVYLDSMLVQTDSTVVRWADRRGVPLRYAIVPDTTIAAWSPRYAEAVRQGINQWNGNAAGITFEEIDAESSGTAEIEITFTATVSGERELGVTDLGWDNRGQASRARISMALHPATGAPPLDPSVVRRVAAHEIGHALGLPHSDDRRDLMYSTASSDQPSRRDQATLQLLYALPPGWIGTP